jgi:hypothetical protein
VENYCAARQITDDNKIKLQKYLKKRELKSIIQSTRFARWITETKDTHLEY